MYRLNKDKLQRLPRALQPETYDRTPKPKVVHLGVGAFHRAHQAWYFDRLNHLEPEYPWLIEGASLRSKSAGEQLNPQDGLYVHVARSAAGSDVTVVQSLTQVVNAFEEPEALTSAIARPDTQLVTLTITEKGYCQNGGNDDLDLHREDVKRDLVSLEHPCTAIGSLLAGLRRRYREKGQPLTILSCDNLSHNGDVTRRAVLAMAEHHEAGLTEWIGDNVSFPNSMVDRIAPAVTAADRDETQKLTGLEDHGLAITEQFSQWVIENNFKGQRPALERVGVTWVDNVDAWELRKLRLLNAAHTALACLGSWLDIRFVHEAISDPRLESLVDQMWRETATTLPDTEDFNLTTYLASLKLRFGNPHLQHALVQIATDSSQKLPQRILAPLAERLAQRDSVTALTTVVAAWLCIQTGQSQRGTDLGFSDPLSETLRRALNEAGDSYRTQVDAVFAVYPALGALGEDDKWREQLIAAYATCRSESHR
ncbi:mannitol dehydrogenase family protein [Congregibacter litoralis]|uniref:Mannitol-1-phosphate/altronate dehydrogenase n=1 Tax=Congregibacter litoralis KT71 TaxID=314285 RepID=A4ADC5_9GAMM|nr:mannitol dehydrogenase family protein [Congregibacter litoralis]EAQ96049.1 Mannitol-1-phosphate/altronate dehydrogenase [Congregibacter litoralis KT71]